MYFNDEAFKHQELFRRIESTIAAKMPAAMRLTADANEVARYLLSKSTWATLAITCWVGWSRNLRCSGFARQSLRSPTVDL